MSKSEGQIFQGRKMQFPVYHGCRIRKNKDRMVTHEGVSLLSRIFRAPAPDGDNDIEVVEIALSLHGT